MCAGYVGYFCLAAGVNLACNVEVLPSAKQSLVHFDSVNPDNVHFIVSLCLQTRKTHCIQNEVDLISCLLQINTFQSWKNIANADALIKLAPAAGATLLLLLTLKLGRSPLALPLVLVCIPVRLWPAPFILGVTNTPMLASPAESYCAPGVCCPGMLCPSHSLTGNP